MQAEAGVLSKIPKRGYDNRLLDGPDDLMVLGGRGNTTIMSPLSKRAPLEQTDFHGNEKTEGRAFSVSL